MLLVSTKESESPAGSWLEVFKSGNAGMIHTGVSSFKLNSTGIYPAKAPNKF